MENISVVERANLSADGTLASNPEDPAQLDSSNLLRETAGYSIQIWYTTPGGQDVILYLITPVELERQDWLLALRNGEFTFVNVGKNK